MLVSAATLVEVGGDFSGILCNIVCLIWYVIAAFSLLVLTVSGVLYISTDNPAKRREARINIIYAVIGLVVVMLAPYASEYLTGGVGILPFDCYCIPLP